MAVNIHNLIAAISPDLFCDSSVKDEVKKIVKEEGPDKGYLKAAEKAKPKSPTYLDFGKLEYTSPMEKKGLKDPIEKHAVLYDASGEALEPLYFSILDSLNSDYRDMKRVDKLIDNFISSPGSGHFSEFGQKATRMQDEAMKILGGANNVIKSILNIIYDLKEFRLRLKLYDQLKSDDDTERRASKLSLKQVWMDTVDAKRGNTSIKGMAQQFQYVTLIDAFMAVENAKGLDDFDLNDRVKRILEQRLNEYDLWLKESERELRKRYEIEKIYLKSQVSTVKLYARWAKPYLRAARSLEQRASPSAALVTAFNTAIFELVLLGESEYKVEDDTRSGNLPKIFDEVKKRKYSPIIIVELNFRSIPERTQQGGYGYRGRFEATFTSYALNDEELKILQANIDRDDMEDVFALMEGSTTQSLEQLQLDIDEFLEDGKEKEEEKKKEQKKEEDINPFSALFSIFGGKGDKKKDDKDKKGIPEKDSKYEEVIRSQAIIKARQECRKIYDTYKKNHQMPAF